MLDLCWDLLCVNKIVLIDNLFVYDAIMSGTKEAQVYIVAIF